MKSSWLVLFSLAVFPLKTILWVDSVPFGGLFPVVRCAWAQAPSQTTETMLRRENDRLQSTIQQLRAKLAERDRDSARQRQAAEALKRQIDSLRHERNVAERERHQARVRAHTLADELKRQEEWIAARERKLDRKKTSTEAELKNSRARIEELQDQLLQEHQRVAEAVSKSREVPGTATNLKTTIPLSRSARAVETSSSHGYETTGAEESHDSVRFAELQRELDQERDRRATLEREVERLTAESGEQDQLHALNRSLQEARAQLLVLGHQLADEQKRRESLEVFLLDIRKAAGLELNPSDPSSWKELAEIIEERRAEAERLAAELRKVEETIVRLKGEIEAQGPGEDAKRLLVTLEAENQKLRTALSSAEETNRKLRGKADLAERLAEMLYSASGE